MLAGPAYRACSARALERGETWQGGCRWREVGWLASGAMGPGACLSSEERTESALRGMRRKVYPRSSLITWWWCPSVTTPARGARPAARHVLLPPPCQKLPRLCVRARSARRDATPGRMPATAGGRSVRAPPPSALHRSSSRPVLRSRDGQALRSTHFLATLATDRAGARVTGRMPRTQRTCLLFLDSAPACRAIVPTGGRCYFLKRLDTRAAPLCRPCRSSPSLLARSLVTSPPPPIDM